MACPQDPVWHAEGDVATHTRMVVEELVHLPAFQDLPERERSVLLLTALLHDCGKPETTRHEPEGRITSFGHSGKGAIKARNLLYDAAIPFTIREEVCALIRFHQRPFYLIEAADPRRVAYAISLSCRADLLTIQAEADARGRVSPTLENSLLSVALFAEFCREHECLTGPRAFASDHSRFLYFRTPERDPDYAAYDDTRGEMLLLSGLPGAGKNTYLVKEHPNLPVISLDAIRTQLKISPSDSQEPVASEGRNQMRVYLRAGQNFAYNATNISREIRALSIRLAAEYNYRVRIVYIEVPKAIQWSRNRAREGGEYVPEAALRRMAGKWEVPDLTEAHTIDRIVSG